jgi:hypothetical protein
MEFWRGRKIISPTGIEPWTCQGQGISVPYAQLKGAHKFVALKDLILD